MNKNYKVIGGISFSDDTNDKVCSILANNCNNGRKQRLRLFYGDTTNGKDWFEVWNTIGYVGRSTGRVKIPLMINNINSLGGGAILDNCIVKITIDKKVVYQHPLYHCPIEVRGNEVWDTEKNVCLFNGKSEKSAQWEYDFFMGFKNSHNYKV